MAKKLIGELELNRIYQRDCIEGMRMLPDDSVDLIVIDPPYNIGKDKRWDKWKTVDAYVEFMAEVFKECERVLKPNGSFYWFHNDMLQVSRLINSINENTTFVYKSMITIDKLDNSFVKDVYGSQSHFRNYLNLAEYCMFYTFQEESGLKKVRDGGQENFLSLKKYFRQEKEKCISEGISIDELIPKTTNFHYFANGLSFGVPTKEKYEILQTTGFFHRPYHEIRSEYENHRYTFNASDGVKNVWSYSFREDKQTKHPTQKPIRLIEGIISNSSNEGDIVLDCFMGSGTTAVAAARINRNFIGFERESEYIEIANKRLDNE